MNWDGITAYNVRSQIVKNEAGAEICTLKEQTHTTSPLTISKQDGTEIVVNSYRTIDFPVHLEDSASGTMHLSLVARDKDGNAPSTAKAVYFTAHYEATPAPDGQPKLKEVSSPKPLKFLGSSKDAVGYIEHGGEIYMLPVTRGKYEEMMREVAKNKGQAIDLSQEVEQKAQDMLSLDQGAASQIGIDGSLQNNRIKDDEATKKLQEESNISDNKNQLMQQSLGFKDKIKTILKTGGKFCFGVAKEVFKQGGVENYAKQQIVKQSKKAGSYVANKVADKLKARLAGQIRQYSSNNEQIKPSAINVNSSIRKSKGFEL